LHWLRSPELASWYTLPKVEASLTAKVSNHRLTRFPNELRHRWRDKGRLLDPGIVINRDALRFGRTQMPVDRFSL
jgi:hypothetical protein